jgi:hypothetical protein
MPSDIDLINFTSAEKWAFFCLLCAAELSGDDGTILFCQDDLGKFCGIESEDEMQALVEKFTDKSLIDIKEDGQIKILCWKENHSLEGWDK